ncbi:hypothetical protein IKX12_03375 [Candidatus Saccharibacteria bacterium]|nr:hypothetical protein [Candidatus Saccharibacteria bacterium]
MDYTLYREQLGDIDPKLVEIFDGVARQVIPSFSVGWDFQPMLAFTVKKTSLHKEKGRLGWTDDFDGSSIVYAPNHSIIPGKSIDYLDWSLGGKQMNFLIARAPVFNCETRVAGNYYTLFVECVETTTLEKLKDDRYGSKNTRDEKVKSYEKGLLDRTKEILKMKLLQSNDYVIAETTLHKFDSLLLTQLREAFVKFQRATSNAFKNISKEFASLTEEESAD